MPDKGDLDSKVKPNINLHHDWVPFKSLGEEYTFVEYQKLKNFMHEDFQHLRYGGKNDKGIIVEYPPEQTCKPEKWKEITDTILIPEIEALDLNFRKNYLIIVRFSDNFRATSNPDIHVAGQGETVEQDKEYWVRVNIKDEAGELKSAENYIFVVMHEILEQDFWQKTKPDDIEAYAGKLNEVNSLQNNQAYRNLLDEKVANRRALRAIRRMWPKANWTDIEDVYEEDK